MSLFAADDVRVTLVPFVAVNSVPLLRSVPFLNTNNLFTEYFSVTPKLSAPENTVFDEAPSEPSNSWS